MKILNYFYKYIFLIFVLLILLTAPCLFYPSFTNDILPGYNDLLQFLNWRVQIQQAFRNHEFPLWSPNEMGGFPILANFQSSLFYPLTFLLFFIDVYTFTDILNILHFVLTPLFMYLFLRYFNYEKIVSIIGAMIWSWSGMLLVRYWTSHSCFIISFTYIPLILFFFFKSIFNLKNNYFYSWFTALFMGFQFFSGTAEYIIYTNLIMFFYLLKFFFFSKKDKFKILKIYLFSIFLFLLFILIQLIPIVEFLNHTIRGKSFEYSVFVSFPYQNFITYFLPYFFGDHVTYHHWGVPNLFEQYAYVGILPWFIILFLIFGKKEDIKSNVFYLLIILLGWSIALGKYNPLYYYISRIIYPLSKLRVPSRAMLLPLFSFVMILSYYLNKIYNAEYVISKKLIKNLYILFFTGIILLLIYFIPNSVAIDFINNFINIRDIELKYLTFNWRLYNLAILLIVYSFLFIKFNKNIKLLFFLLFIVCFYETIIFHRNFIDYNGTDFSLLNDKYIQYLKNDDSSKFRVLSTEHKMEIPKYNINNIASAQSYSPMLIASVIEYFAVGVDGRYNYLDETSKTWFGLNTILNYNSKLIDLFNVKYLVGYNVDSYDDNYKKIFNGLHKNLKYKDRFKFYYDNINISDYDKSLQILKSDSFNIDDVIIVNNANIKLGDLSNHITDVNSKKNNNGNLIDVNSSKYLETDADNIKFNKTEFKSEININVENNLKNDYSLIAYNFNSIEFDVNILKDSILFLSEVYYPGWKVFVDGIEKDVLILNNIFRGVFLREGNKHVRFVYSPNHLKYGIFFISFFFLIGIFLIIESVIKIL